MRATIDKFGRIVVPKEMRERAGLRPGSEIEIDEQDKEIVIKQAGNEPLLQDEDGVLVFAGTAAGDIAGSVRRSREERILKVSSGK